MTTLRQIDWLAGIIDGEGCFSSGYNNRGNFFVQIQIQMTDLDIIEKFKLITKATASINITPSGENRKPSYRIQVQGDLAIQWMMTIYSLMGIRRKQKIRDILTAWKAYDGHKNVEIAATTKIRQFAKMWNIDEDEARKRIELLKSNSNVTH